jgi:endonuclease III
MKHANRIIEVLESMYPNANVELTHHNHFELLVAVVLSAQTTDKSVNLVTPKLFSKFPTPSSLAKATFDEVVPLIKSIGLYQNKAKNIIALAKVLVEKHHGQVPQSRDALEALPGVGRKTANVVLSNAFNEPAFAVDTHVERVSKRLGIAKKSDSVLNVEKKLNKAFPKASWQQLHHQMIFFGRYHCKAQKPNCQNCFLKDICKYEFKDKI